MGTLVINLTMGYHHCATLFLVLYAACLLMVCSQAKAISGNDTDRLALLQLKAKITMDPHGVMASWNDSTHFCSWFGVTCGKRHPRVTQLNLTSLELGGSISPHIGNMSFLRVIDMSYNALSDQIPQEVGYLRRLKTLILYNNSLSGEIPSNISRCTQLLHLVLANNSLAGGIPKELGSLSKLQRFTVYNNALTGEIPSSLGNLSSIQTLNIGYNRLAGSIPETIGQLKLVTFLGIGNNQLSGSVPPSIFNISSLIKLAICWNHLQGHLPSDLFIMLPNLKVLYVDVNQFTGFIPSSLSNASNLAYLDASSNKLSGKVPSLHKLKALNYLDVSNNSLGTRGPGDLDFLCTLANATDLQTLVISNNEFGGSIPECINALVSLTYLDASYNKLSVMASVSSSNWLDRLRSSRGFPTGDDLDLDRFLSTSSSGSVPTTGSRSTHSESTHSQPPTREVRNNSGGCSDVVEASNVLCDLFNMGEGGSSRGISKKKSPRKQANPRFCSSSENNNELCSSDDLRRDKSENGLASSGDNSLNERREKNAAQEQNFDGEMEEREDEDVDLKAYSRSEVFVIDTSLKDRKFD